jgi:spermidine synthase
VEFDVMGQLSRLDEVPIPGTDQSLALYQRKDDFFIRISGQRSSAQDLMNSRAHGSEDALGRLPCERIVNPDSARVLIGGLGMGFTLAAALKAVGSDAVVTVAELIPRVVDWNRGPLGIRSGRPLDDPRTRVHLGDVGKLLVKSPGCFDVIALDVDNGPEGLTSHGNDWLYSMAGIAVTQDALRPGGILAYWSAGQDQDFHERLRCSGFLVEEIRVRGHGNKGSRYIIWLAHIN